MEYVYGIGAGEVFWAASDIGWVVGHSYIVYGPLLLGATTILYERKPVGTPDPGAFWRVTEQHGVNAIFTAPTAFRAIRKEDPRGEHISRHDLSRFRTLFLAGERCDPDTLLWAQGEAGCAGDRPLVADRNRLGHRRQLRWARDPPRQARVPHQAGAWLRRPRARRGQTRDAKRANRYHRHQATDAARLLPDSLEQRHRIRAVLPVQVPGLLPNR